GAQLVGIARTPHERPNDLVAVAARLPPCLLRWFPRRVVGDQPAQSPVVPGLRERVCLRGDIAGAAHPTSGSALTMPAGSRRSSSISCAIAMIAPADSASGRAETTGAPASPCSRSTGSSGTD